MQFKSFLSSKNILILFIFSYYPIEIECELIDDIFSIFKSEDLSAQSQSMEPGRTIFEIPKSVSENHLISKFPDLTINLTRNASVLPTRLKRETYMSGYSKEGHRMFLDLHNMYRSNVTPPAANMRFLEYDDYLAYLAQLWADNCEFEHGTPPGTSYPLGSYGQNLYLGGEPTGYQAMLMWYEEFVHYNMFTRRCVPGEQCGHYVAMAWGPTKKLGCGMARCNNRYLIVCHYYPPVLARTQMYKVGKPCSQCEEDDGAVCYENKCMSWDQCSRNPEQCGRASCNLQCQNCGVLDKNRCKCICASGWDSFDCSQPCVNSHKSCGQNPGFPDERVCHMSNGRVKNVLCRKMCHACEGVETNSEKTCCNGKMCPEGNVLDDNCNCKPSCVTCGVSRIMCNLCVILFLISAVISKSLM